MKSSVYSGSLIEQSASLPGSDAALERALAPGQLARLARGLARARGVDRLRDDLPRVGRVLLEELREPRFTVCSTKPRDPRVAELRLRLALELRVAELHRDDRREALAHVLALEVVLLLLEQALVARVLVQRRASSAERKPERCAPPSWVLMLLANEKTDS